MHGITKKVSYVYHPLFWYVIELYNGYIRSAPWNDEAPWHVDEAVLTDVVVLWIPEKIPIKIKKNIKTNSKRTQNLQYTDLCEN